MGMDHSTANEGESSPHSSTVQPAQNPYFQSGSACWTARLPKTKHVDYFREADFGSTSLGALESWGVSLRLYIPMLFADKRGAVIFWGPDNISIYNEPWAPFVGDMHPTLMAQSFESAFPDLIDVSATLQEVKATGESVTVNHIRYFLERDGYVEETYFIGQFMPLYGDSGRIEGIYNTARETTQEVLFERRRKAIDEVADIAASADSLDHFLDNAIGAAKSNPLDIPLALLFSYDELAEIDTNDLSLRGTIGVPAGHPIAPTKARLKGNDPGIISYFRRTLATKEMLVLHRSEVSVDANRDIFDGILWGGYGEPSPLIVIVPLWIRGSVQGFYVQGSNPRRNFGDASRRSLIDFTRQLESKWESCISAESARLREAALVKRASESENRLQHMATYAPLGMAQAKLDHQIQWANDQFYDMTNAPRTITTMEDFFEVLDTDSRTLAFKSLEDACSAGKPATDEYRLNRPWAAPPSDGHSGEESFTWILMSVFPLLEKGRPKIIMCYLADISHQKWAESVQSRAAKAATEARRRQEEFIDTTSHEMRNPLTAITQLADGIHSSATGVPASLEAYQAAMAEHADAANTIGLCAAHQRRVIDDVLTLSRLESQMLTLSMAPTRTNALVSDAVKMYDATIAATGIDLVVEEDPSYKALGVKSLLLDSGRVMQVLINLLANSIKFTAQQSDNSRSISITYGLKEDPPIALGSRYGDLAWTNPCDAKQATKSCPPQAMGSEDKDRVYAYFRIEDTGAGMTSEGTEKLFKRWSQAAPRTQSTYGGNGLGLYICRQLTVKHGGDIGVSSKYGEGSCFAFYIEAKRNPDVETEATEEMRQNTAIHSGSASNAEAGSHDLVSSVSREMELPMRTGRGRKADDVASQTRKPGGAVPSSPESMNVLLVEDNIVNQKVLNKQLKVAGCTVVVANNGAEALQVLETSTCWHGQSPHKSSPVIEIVLMDWEMPVMNGLDCTKRIRELEVKGFITKRLHVIGVTANVRKEQIEQAMASGMDHIVSKPFTTRQLLAKMSEAMSGG